MQVETPRCGQGPDGRRAGSRPLTRVERQIGCHMATSGNLGNAALARLNIGDYALSWKRITRNNSPFSWRPIARSKFYLTARTHALVKWHRHYSLRRASAGGTAMEWRAGNRQARSALRARSVAAVNKLPAVKAFCIQWARTAPRRLSKVARAPRRRRQA